MRRLFQDSEHLFRMAGLFVIGTTSFFVVRAMMVPEDFGVYGHYRTGAIAENAAQQLAFAGRAACADCHDDQAGTIGRSAHAGVGCESCHGPLASHVADPSTVPTRPEPDALCAGCHAALAARPDWFPQVDIEDHAGDVPCDTCHEPHSPGLGDE